MDVIQFYTTVAAVFFANLLTICFLYAGREYDRAKAEGRDLEWKYIFMGIIPCAIGAYSATFIGS